jgi:hypothetical protein
MVWCLYGYLKELREENKNKEVEKKNKRSNIENIVNPIGMRKFNTASATGSDSRNLANTEPIGMRKLNTASATGSDSRNLANTEKNIR